MVHVLVADDEEKVRNVIADALRLAGYTVAEACNGREAVACFIAAPTDIVLMDLLMPVKDGIEAILEIRRAAPAAKIIAMSGGGHIAATDYLAWAQAIGVNRTLEKPFRLNTLITLIEELARA